MRLAVALLGLLLLAGGCSDPTGPEEARLTAAQRRWESTRPTSNSYTMQQRVLCFCVTGSTTFQVTVTAGSITRAVNLTTGESLSVTLLTIFRTVDQLFAQAREGLTRAGVVQSMAFDAALGYPTTLSLDPVRDAIDDEVTYITSNVAPLTP
ncbi:DUF6174 domain-containing protein [Gemmatimonas sp.]|uniref:DUF6174 domain-containing protein n=1 Tax=Gemmatimonas sp. TaxID=1962908 RepID=UPI00286A79A7|nr:DUF6174 domain-containing protein [Gemmatimonas sp.]